MIVLFGLIFSGNGATTYTVGLVNLDTGQTGQAINFPMLFLSGGSLSRHCLPCAFSSGSERDFSRRGIVRADRDIRIILRADQVTPFLACQIALNDLACLIF